jgi:DNA repair protein RadC
MTIHIPDAEKVQVVNSQGVFKIMHDVLLREEDIDRGREHFWIISLAHDNQILNIELISLGSMSKTIVEPTEVFSFALQKRAAKIILVHNHPSGRLIASDEDLDLTDRLVQVGKIVNCPVIDHLIITVESYTSFADCGILARLEKSTKYALDFEGVNIKRAVKNNTEELAIKMLQNQKYELEEIKGLTGLTAKQLEKLKKELSDQKK